MTDTAGLPEPTAEDRERAGHLVPWLNGYISEQGYRALITDIAQALAAERERCAKVLDTEKARHIVEAANERRSNRHSIAASHDYVAGEINDLAAAIRALVKP